jgi:hypothetical protein
MSDLFFQFFMSLALLLPVILIGLSIYIIVLLKRNNNK